MITLLAVLVAVAAVAALLSGAFALGLGRSDPAGDGLGQAYVATTTLGTALLVVAALLCAWFLPARPTEATVVTVTTALGVVIALTLPVALLSTQCASATRRTHRSVLAGLGTAAWFGLLLQAAAHGFAWPMPTGIAGIGAYGPAAAALAFAASVNGHARRRREQPASPFTITFPALVLRDGEAVFVVREAAGLAALDPQVFRRSPQPATIDANGTVWWLQPAAQIADWPTRRDAASCPFATLRDRVLALPRLHHDPTQDATIRRLVAQQESITALSFVLPR